MICLVNCPKGETQSNLDIATDAGPVTVAAGQPHRRCPAQFHLWCEETEGCKACSSLRLPSSRSCRWTVALARGGASSMLKMEDTSQNMHQLQVWQRIRCVRTAFLSFHAHLILRMPPCEAMQIRCSYHGLICREAGHAEQCGERGM